MGERTGKVVSVTADDFVKPGQKKEEPQAINLDLHTHPTIEALGLLGPKDMSSREWEVGDKLIFNVIGVTKDGVTDGIKIT